MPDYSARKPPHSELEQSGALAPIENSSVPAAGSDVAKAVPQADSDLAHLAGLFAAHGGGSFSEEFSANLALEIVLHEIVEQVCLTTGATGAAIVLLNGEEMMCRARSGTTVPAPGSRLAGAAGLSGECLRTHQVQRCDDVRADPRADAEASQNLGVRSVMIFPLLEGTELLGMLEIFSSRPAAFGQREENTLGAFAGRVRENLRRARGPFRAAEAESVRKHQSEPSFGTLNVPQEVTIPAVVDRAGGEASVVEEKKTSWGGFDYLTLALGALVLGCAVLLGTLVEQRMGTGHSRATVKAVLPSVSAGTQQPVAGAAPGMNNVPAQESGPSEAEPDTHATESGKGMNPSAGIEGRTAARKRTPEGPTEGGLTVYENGKEVFHLSAQGAGGQMERAATLEREAGKDRTTGAESMVVRRIEPEYPEEARAEGVQGAVVLHVRIGGAGGVEDVKPLSGSPLLVPAAMAAVKQWKFKPRVVDGKAAEMETTVTVNFKLPEREP
jgi:TonB family protein